MKYLSRQIVFREVPDEISLSYLVTGCPFRCVGCHSSDSWNPKVGQDLTRAVLEADLDRYGDWISCVLFLGGEWESETLVELLVIARSRGYKTCLYTGAEDVPSSIRIHLNYLKVGPFIAAKGGLDRPTTNQRFFDLDQQRCLNQAFQSTGGSDDSTHA